jgi:hypothetical protein
LVRIERESFAQSGLTSAVLPASVELICERAFFFCSSLTEISFECDSRLTRLEREAFSWSGLTSVQRICELCFAFCSSLPQIRFELDARLSHIEREVFSWSALTAIAFPVSVEVICESCISHCQRPRSVTIDPQSPFRASSFSRAFLLRFPMVFPHWTPDIQCSVA